MSKYNVHIICDEVQYMDDKGETNYFVNRYFESMVSKLFHKEWKEI
ncbi:hypothetical protein [Clostridium estertheticum]|nr:hypothetical protein [Clostridium estertheticum]MBU3171686.1 hypothetical protein [Clostridium estertheticum]MBZ9618377.1 hypothetical protein [Clostridium estertheticum subsp. laramiense]WAG76382.1 hypothetical protein LL032_23350 [Clostridium estertheticum]